MLAKSHARIMFIGTTLGFSLVFLGLTVDSIAQVPARSHEDKLTPQVVRGKEVWEENNCMGCHTILGEGAYYAPELTKVVERRGKEWIKIFIKDPQAMFPGERKMVKYDFTPEQIDDVIAFLEWVGNIETNGFPAKPDMAPVQVSAAPASTNDGKPSALASAPPMFTSVCQACHAVEGKGGVVGPALDGVANRYDAVKLDAWLKDPQALKPGTAMPNLALPDDTRAALVTWLMSLK